MGVVGKIRLTSNVSLSEVENEIKSVFDGPMGAGHDFSFQFLQSTGFRSRTIAIPSFNWSVQQVAKLSNLFPFLQVTNWSLTWNQM